MTKNTNIANILDQADIFVGPITVGNTTVNVVANSTSIKLANSTVNTGIVVPTAAQYAGSYYLHANGNWASVTGGGTPGGANTQVQFNDSTAFNGTAGFTFSKDTNNVLIANTLTVGASGNTINSTVWTGKSYTANDSTNLGGTAAASYQLNSTLAANVATMSANNATWHGTSIFANSTGAYPTSNTVGAVLGNTISRVIITGNSATFSSTLAATDTTITGFVNATVSVNSALHTIGTTFIANTLGVYHTGVMNAASHTTSGITANTTGIWPTSNTVGQTLGGTTQRWIITANSLNITGSLSANGGIGSAAQVLTSDGTIAYWANGGAGGGTIATKNYQAFTATAGQTIFTMTNTFANSLVDVFYNGIHLANTEFTTNSAANTITLADAANLNSIVEVSAYSNATISSFTAAPGGANTYVQYNDSSILGGSAGFTFDKTTNNMVIANTLTIGSSVVNTTALTVGSSVVNTTAFKEGANVFIDTTKLSIGNTVANLTANSIIVTLANSSSTANLTPLALTIGTSVVNSTAVLKGGAAVLTASEADQVITGGSRVTVNDLGSIASGTVTPDPGDRPMQKYTNAGAHTLAPGSNYGNYLLDVLNTTGAGAITTSGWTKVAGDAFDTTTTSKFRCHASITADASLLSIQKVV